MVSGLINTNPIVYEKKERRAGTVPRPAAVDEYEMEVIDQLEMFDRKDPEHDYSLEEVKVISEDAIELDDKQSHVDIRVAPGTHATEAAVNKQLKDKERVAACHAPHNFPC